jgi:hypothetical protein
MLCIRWITANVEERISNIKKKCWKLFRKVNMVYVRMFENASNGIYANLVQRRNVNERLQFIDWWCTWMKNSFIYRFFHFFIMKKVLLMKIDWVSKGRCGYRCVLFYVSSIKVFYFIRFKGEIESINAMLSGTFIISCSKKTPTSTRMPFLRFMLLFFSFKVSA